MAFVSFDGDVDVPAIQVLTQWPGKNGNKVPSRITWPQDPPRTSWGFEAEEGFVTYSWTKIILNPSVDLYEFQDEAFGALTRSLIMQLPPGKQA